MDHDDQKQHRRLSLKVWGIIAVAGAVPAAVRRLGLTLGYGSVRRRLRALRSAGFPTSLAEWVESRRLPEGTENAADLYEEGCNLFASPQDDANVPILGRGTLPERGVAWPEPMVKAVTAYLESNQRCRALVEEATHVEQCRFSWEYISTFPDLTGMANCARLIELETLLHAQHRDANAVVNCLRRMLYLSSSVRYEPTLMVYLIRIFCLQRLLIGLEYALSMAAFTDEQLRELDAMLAQTVATLDFTEVMVSERCWMIEMFQDPSRLVDYCDGDVILRLPGVANMRLMAMLDYVADVAEALKLPPAPRLSRLRAIDAERWELPSWHFLSKCCWPALGRMGELDLRLRTRIDMSRIALAIERYRLVTGWVPERLEVLVPQYLDAAPLDPFDGQPIRYRNTEPGYLLYSIMEDGQDNGGRTRDEVKRGEPYDLCFIVTR